jgi:zinc protease
MDGANNRGLRAATLRFLLLLFAVALLGSCAGGGAVSGGHAAGPAPEAQFRMRDFRLRSGLRIIVEEDHSAPIVGIVNVVGAGSTSDPPGKEGIAHLVEHLTFRAQATPGRSVWSLFDQAGASLVNARTGWDSTIYYEYGPRDSLGDMLTLEGVRIVDPLARVDGPIFNVERDVVQNELRQTGETSVAGAVYAELQKAVFPPGYPNARPVVGTHESLSALSLEDARAFAKEHYRPANMTLLVIGDVRLESFEEVLAKTLAASLNEPIGEATPPAERLPARAPEPPAPPPSQGIVEIEGRVTSPTLYFAWSLPRGFADASDMGRLALYGVHGALAGADREDTNMQSFSAGLDPGRQASLLWACVVLRDGANVERSAEHVLNQLYRSWVGPEGEPPRVAEVRFAQQKAAILTRTAVEAQDIRVRGLERAQVAHFSGDASLYTRSLQALAGVGRGDLATYHSAYLNRDRARIVLVRPPPPERRAPEGRTGIGWRGDEDVGPISYDVASIPRIALPVGFASSFQSETLDNGLLIESARRGLAGLVTIGLTFRHGSSEEAHPGAAALALMTATTRSVNGEFRNHGAVASERMESDHFSFEVHTHASHLGAVLTILADQVESLRVHDASMRNFEQYHLEHAKKATMQPERVAGRAFRRALFGKHPYADSGDFPETAPPDESAANDWLDATLRPSNATLVVVGDVDPAEAQRLAKSAFGGWSGGPASASPEPLDEQGEHAAIVVHRPGSTQAEIRVGCRMPKADADEFLRQDVLAHVVGDRLDAIIRKSLGATYGFHAGVETLRGGSSVLYLWGAVENGGLEAALRVVRGELTGAPRLTNADFDRGRWALARSYDLGLATPDLWVTRALDFASMGWQLASIDKQPAVLASFDRARYVEALRRCAKEGVVSIVGDEPTARRAVAKAWP